MPPSRLASQTEQGFTIWLVEIAGLANDRSGVGKGKSGSVKKTNGMAMAIFQQHW